MNLMNEPKIKKCCDDALSSYKIRFLGKLIEKIENYPACSKAPVDVCLEMVEETHIDMIIEMGHMGSHPTRKFLMREGD